MNKYDTYKQELIQELLNRQIDAFGLIDYVIELCEKLDRQDEIIKQLGGIINVKQD